MVIKRIARFLGRRRSKAGASSASAPRVDRAPATPPAHRASSKALVIWESELRAIAAEAAAWTVETGGDLFGRWSDGATVFLATKAGPNAQRDNAHFRLDVDYLRQLSEPLAADWPLRYFGDWHSHHRLGLSAPSSGDRRRIRQLGKRNAFPGMAEIIVTTEGSRQAPTVRIHPWFYDLCVPQIRFCNIDGEGRQGQVVRRRRRGAQSRDGEGRPCSEIDGSSTHYNRRHIRVGSGAGALRQTRSCGRDIRGGSSR